MSDWLNQIVAGDAIACLQQLPAGVARCCVTSPPYWGLRDYGVDGQLGLEGTVEEYVGKMVNVFREVRRVLADDGTLWLNMGDSYAGSWSGNSMRPEGGGQRSGEPGFQPLEDGRYPARGGAVPPGLKPKDLVGMPWRLAFALQADGWWLRSDIVWSKPNPMPESIRDRPTKSHEYIFLLTKAPRYFFDQDAVREAGDPRSAERYKYDFSGPVGATEVNDRRTMPTGQRDFDGRRNIRTVWDITVHGFAQAHFATFPPELVSRCVRAGSSAAGQCAECGSPWRRLVDRAFVPQKDVSQAKGVRGHGDQKPMDDSSGWEGFPRGTTEHRTTGWKASCDCGAPVVPDLVIDPFGGAGTTALVAKQLQRSFWSCDLNPDYVAMALRRIGRPALGPSEKEDLSLFE